jgi:hypothetical protein
MVKKYARSLFLALSMASAPAFAHHMAADIVDEDIYAMIDALVADTPHASLDLDNVGAGMTVVTVTTSSVDEMSDFLDDGALGYIEELSGTAYTDITINDDGSAVLTVQHYGSENM